MAFILDEEFGTIPAFAGDNPSSMRNSRDAQVFGHEISGPINFVFQRRETPRKAGTEMIVVTKHYLSLDQCWARPMRTELIGQVDKSSVVETTDGRALRFSSIFDERRRSGHATDLHRTVSGCCS